MQQLEVGVLAVSAGFTVDKCSGFNVCVKTDAALSNRLAVRLHIELLQVSWEPEQGLLVRRDISGCNLSDISVVESDESKHHGSILECRKITLALGEVAVN